jgi:hypothetical protein
MQGRCQPPLRERATEVGGTAATSAAPSSDTNTAIDKRSARA